MSGRKLSGVQSRKRKKNAEHAAKKSSEFFKTFFKKLSQTNLSQKTVINWLSLLLTRLSNNREGDTDEVIDKFATVKSRKINLT